MDFKDLDPLLHNELRLKIMAALDSLDDADFVYLKSLTYIKVSKSGEGRGSHTVCRITSRGIQAMKDYQRTLMQYFTKP